MCFFLLSLRDGLFSRPELFVSFWLCVMLELYVVLQLLCEMLELIVVMGLLPETLELFVVFGLCVVSVCELCTVLFICEFSRVRMLLSCFRCSTRLWMVSWILVIAVYLIGANESLFRISW